MISQGKVGGGKNKTTNRSGADGFGAGAMRSDTQLKENILHQSSQLNLHGLQTWSVSGIGLTLHSLTMDNIS